MQQDGNTSTDNLNEMLVLGWREWFSLPDLGIARIKAKIDTGARTSALHAFEVNEVQKTDGLYVQFRIHPDQTDLDQVITCECPVFDQWQVTDSGGHKELRYVIQTIAVCGPYKWNINMTLTNRETMRFRMLLGRTAMEGKFLVNPQASFLQGEHPEL